ncbi:carbohydrate ABC transporter permease [Desertimonas flava]|uniref:carbohydrate ABC transporter permease n=1 Tax=Desertimonas flava TaxID=2064846 RepID=UPI0019693D3D|nr:sugar ABC transporter permease [Desertimonas flava]
MTTLVLVPAVPVPVADDGAVHDSTALARRRPMATRVAAYAIPYLLLAPAALTLAIWTYRPLASTIGLSFHDWNLLPTTPKEWVGTRNYAEILRLPELRRSLGITGWMMLGLVPFTLVIPTVVALVTHRMGTRSRNLYRAALFVPVLITPVVAAAVWRWLLSTSGGVYQQPLEWLGRDPVNWFRDARPALVAVVLVAGWKMLGFATLMVSAGVSSIDPSYQEAASIDGASDRRIRWRVTLPLLSPTLTFMGLMTVLLTAQWLFPLIQLLTQGGPAGATTNVYYLLYTMGFTSFDAGRSSAAGVLFFAAFGILAVGCLKLMDKLSFYDD